MTEKYTYKVYRHYYTPELVAEFKTPRQAAVYIGRQDSPDDYTIEQVPLSLEENSEEFFLKLMIAAEKKIGPVLPETHDMDDCHWGDDGFVIPVFDVSDSRPFHSKLVSEFRFVRYHDELYSQMMERFQERLDRYTQSWQEGRCP